MELDGTQNQLGHFGEKKMLSLLSGIEQHFIIFQLIASYCTELN